MQVLSNGAIRMSSVSTDDAGMYECVATSEAGNATKVIELIVQGAVVLFSLSFGNFSAQE